MKQKLTVLLLLFACVGVGWGQYSVNVSIDGGPAVNYVDGDNFTFCSSASTIELEAVIDLATADPSCSGSTTVTISPPFVTPFSGSRRRYYLERNGAVVVGTSTYNGNPVFPVITAPYANTENYVIDFYCNASGNIVHTLNLTGTQILQPTFSVTQPVLLCEEAVGSNLTPTVGTVNFTETDCAGCSNYEWTFSNGYVVNTTGNVLTTDYNTILAGGGGASFSTLEITNIQATGPSGCVWTDNTNHPVTFENSPTLNNLTVSGPICEDPAGVTTAPATSTVDIGCSSCVATSWDLMFSNGHHPTGVGFPYSVNYTDVIGANDVYAVANVGGCSWTSAVEPISVGAAPFTDFVGPTTPTVLMQGNSPEDLTTYLQPSASAGASYSLLAGSAGLILGSDYYPVQLGTATLAVSETTAAGCVYSDETIVEVVDQFNLLNTTTVGQGREVCVGDDLRVLVYNIPGNPQFLRFSTAAGGTTTVAIPSTTPAGGGNFNVDMTLSVPNSWVSGPVEILDNSNNVLMSSPQGLIVNNPSLGLAFAKNPICYSDEVAVYGQPAGGVLSAYDLPGAVPNTNLLTQISGTDYINASGVALTDTSENHEVEQIRVEYEYQPSYSDGTACPSTVSITKDIDIRDDRLFTAFLPDVVEDQSTYNLGDSISDVYPDPVGTMAAKPIDFSGTHIQPNGTSYEFLPQAAGAGFHPLEFSIENSGGCSAVGGAAVHVLAKPSEDALADTICSTTGTFNFSRDINLSHSPFDPSFATVNRADCGQQVSGLRPMAPGTAGGGRQLGQNLYADSSIQLPIGGIWVGDSSYFAYNSNLQQAARLGCADVLAMSQGRERYRITKVAAFANDGGLPPNLAAIQAGTNEIAGANVSTNGLVV